MKLVKQLIIITLISMCYKSAFSQATDSLSLFPNPFGSSATIHFDIVQSDTITLRVFNKVGQTIRTYFQTTVLPSGSYNINLLGDSLADDIYFIKLDVGSKKSLMHKALKVGSTLGIINPKSNETITFYPNPVIDQLTIPINGNKTIILTDINGKILKTFTTDQQIISLLDISAGQYLITILSNQNEIITIQKILKIE